MAAINLHYPKMKVFQLTSTQVASGAKIYTYEAGTSTDKATYSDQSLSTANANPVIADSNGEAQVWLRDDGLYKIVINDSSDVLISSTDNIGTAASVTDTEGLSNLVPNGSFESNSGDNGTPTGWTLSITGASTIQIDKADTFHGGSCLEFVGGASGAGYSESGYFAVSESTELGVRFSIKSSAVTVGQTIDIYWFQDSSGTASGVTTSTTVYSDSTTVPTSWEEILKFVTPPSDGLFAKVHINGSTSAGTTRYDNIEVYTPAIIAPVIGADIIAALALPVDITGDYHDVTALAAAITDISGTNPPVVTAASHGLTNGEIITLSGVGGLTLVNGNTYTVANQTTNTFELSGIDLTLTITGATQANPVVITSASHGMSNSDTINIASVGGMTDLNGNSYTVANKTNNTFELSGINGTGYGAYTSGGVITPDDTYTSGGAISINVTSLNTVRVGAKKTLQFDGVTLLTHHATNLILPGGEDLLTIAGDVITLLEYASGDWVVISSSLPATGAIAIAGTDNNRFVTSEGLASSKDLSVDGYMDLPGGLLLQWGDDTAASPATITFPKEFPTACLVAFAGVQNDITRITSTGGYTTTTMTVYKKTTAGADSTVDVTWFAIGH